MAMTHTLAQQRAAQRKKGFTLTEIAIVLGIIGLILGAIWTAATAVYQNQRIAHADTAVLQIVQGIRSLYASSSTTGYSTATNITATLETAGAVPTDLINTADTTNLYGPFPGGKTMIVATSDGGGFGISMSNVAQPACINLLSTIGGTARDAGLFNASAEDNTDPAVSDFTSTGTPLTTTITPAIAVAGIGGSAPTSGYGGCTAAVNKVLFGFSLK